MRSKMVKQCPIYTLENVTCSCFFANFPITDLKIRDSKNNLNLLVPDRFTYNGVPCDQDGIEVNNYVCPNCTFDIPIRFLEHSTYYISMVGAPNTGKTYYSASMYYEILKLAEGYPITVTRADIMTNDTLGTYYRALYRTHEARSAQRRKPSAKSIPVPSCSPHSKSEKISSSNCGGTRWGDYQSERSFSSRSENLFCGSCVKLTRSFA